MALQSIYNFGDLKPYFEDGKRHFYYNKCKELCDKFAPHADGVYPEELIECRRPNEPLEVKEYRKKIWKPKTKPTFTKIISSLSKIRRSSDWSIKYPQEGFDRIAEGEKLEDYCERKFPYFDSLTTWVFAVLLKKYLTDPNACIMVTPLKTEGVLETEYLKPYPFVFDSCDVIEFIDGESAILNIKEGCTYESRQGRGVYSNPGKSYYIVTKEVIERWDQIDNKGNYTIVSSYVHSRPVMPVFKIGAIIAEAEGNHFLYESRIEGIIPDLDEAVREYSDLQAAKVLHVYPERWEFTQNECGTCKGLGRRRNPLWFDGCNESTPTEVPCDAQGCRNGYIAAGPYTKMYIRPTNNALEGGGSIPNPPAGIVEKDIEIVKLMEASVKQHIYDALASINFQFLEQTPLNQSGTAKEVDKEELNNTVHAIAEDLVKTMDRVYRLIAMYRYKTLYPNDIDKMVPAIAVPEHYDLLSSQFMQTEIDTAKKSKMNPIIINAMEVEYSGKRFMDDPEIKDRLELVLQLDPLPNVSMDDKMGMLSNSTITKETAVISDNIHAFVQRAIEENPEFPKLEVRDQKAKMLEYAKAQILESSAAGRVLIPQLEVA